MSIIQFKEANCKNCHKCIRHCPVKSIRFQNEQARILEQDCVLCGSCILACPQNAKMIKSDLEEVKQYIASGAKVFASVAPSFGTAFGGASFTAVAKALQRLGFVCAEETAIGAGHVSAELSALMQQGEMRHIFTTCCPTTVMLVEKYYPELVQYLAPVVSPATAHAKLMKNMYGSKIKVVFIGPCISKKHEAENGTAINATLMFDELATWLEEEGISPEDSVQTKDEPPVEMNGVINRLYPVPGGIIHTIPRDKRKKYTSIAIDGMDRCIEILDSIRDNPELGNYFLELSACKGSCVEGPGLHSFSTPFLLSREYVVSSAKKKPHTPPLVSERASADLSVQYKNQYMHKNIPSDAVIAGILLQIGKSTPDKMYNCGACGYPTCRDKAIAVYQGKAELRMCIPYMREKAESMSNIILDNTPNAIFVVDGEFKILEFNRAAITMLDMTELDYIGLPVEMLIGRTGIDLHESGESAFDVRAQINGKTIEQTIVPIYDSGNHIIIVKDATDEQERQEKLTALRGETIETAQQVIEKQMRVAQEIASLLGETTGETKAALTKLKKTMSNEL